MGGDKKTILIVEAEASIRDALCDSIERYGLIALQSSDTTEAIKLLQRRAQIDLVYANIDISGSMDALDLARWVLNSRPETAIILISAKVGDTKIREELQIIENCVRFQKSYRFDELPRRIHEIIQLNDLRLNQKRISGDPTL